MKRILCLLCILALAAGLLAACGKSDPTPPPPELTTAYESAEEGNDINSFEDLENAFNQLGQMFSVTWPENEFTRQVPKPKFEVGLGAADENSFGILTSASVDQLKDYVKDLKKAGFDKNDNTEDQNIFGMQVYSYEAHDGKGYKVEIAYAMGMSTITITKAMG